MVVDSVAEFARICETTTYPRKRNFARSGLEMPRGPRVANTQDMSLRRKAIFDGAMADLKDL
jgi:hypothetical protein